MTRPKQAASKAGRRKAAKKPAAARTGKAPVVELVRSPGGRAPAAVASRPREASVEKLHEEGVRSLGPAELLASEAAKISGADLPTEGRYVYGIIAASEPINFGRTGLGGSGEQVYTVHYNDIAAVVSKTSVFIFDPTRENALAHEHVIETVMRARTIIPMSFGTVFRTDEDIREVLRSIYASLKDVLDKMEGRMEFGLKVTWERDRIIEELKREDEEIHKFHVELTKKHLQSTYFARMQLGRMIDKALAERAAGFVREIYDGLRSVCVASRDNKPIGDKMIMNAAFLIEQPREAEFDAAVNRVAKKFGERLNFKYTGPWPPYNFVNIRLKLERGTAT